MSSFIPKRIFYVWLGSSKPADVLQSVYQWKQMLPDYEIVELNETSAQYFDFADELKNNLWFKTVYEKKMWAYAADYIRCKALYEHGGIYLDTDISVVKKFDDILSLPAFIGKQSSDSVNLAVIGCQKHNQFIKEILDFYNEDIWTHPVYSIPDIATYLLEHKHQQKFAKKDDVINLSDLTIFPESWFYPYAYHSNYSDECVTPDTYTIHWWKESWCKAEISAWLKAKHTRPKEQSIKAELFPQRRIYLFSFLCLFDYKPQTGWIYISGIKLPFIKIKSVYNRIKIKLFNLITLFKIR